MRVGIFGCGPQTSGVSSLWTGNSCSERINAGFTLSGKTFRNFSFQVQSIGLWVTVQDLIWPSIWWFEAFPYYRGMTRLLVFFLSSLE